MERIALYPGTFDILTHGHLDIIRRASGIVDRLVIGVAANEKKGPLFTHEERVEMVRESVSGLSNVSAEPLDGLTVDFAHRIGASLLVRGLRAVSDFEYELQMALMNRQLAPGIESIFLAANSDQIFISSRVVQEVGRLGGDISAFVPHPVAVKLLEKLGRGPSQSA